VDATSTKSREASFQERPGWSVSYDVSRLQGLLDRLQRNGKMPRTIQLDNQSRFGTVKVDKCIDLC
jgi:hypothetical protein